MNDQEIRAKALELAIRHMALYPPILDNIYKNSITDDPAAFAHSNGLLSYILPLSAKYEEQLKQA
jgi:hypothetical protein